MGKKKGKAAKGSDDGMGKKGKKGKKGKGETGEETKGKKGKKGKKGSSSIAQPAVVPAAEPAPIVEEPRPSDAEAKAAAETALKRRNSEECCCEDKEVCRPNRYPGILECPEKMAVVGSECGSYESLCRLLRAGFRCADRVFAMTPWGNYVVFRVCHKDEYVYFIYDGCTCNVNRFRYLDITVGTAGLLYFTELHRLINYMRESCDRRLKMKSIRKSVIDDICKEFCEYGYH